MQIKQSTISWFLIFTVTFIILYLVSPIMMPFVFGVIVAYFLDPLADRLEERGLSRGAATSIVLGTFLVILTAVILIFGPIFVQQVADFASKIPGYVAHLQQQYGAEVEKAMRKFVPDFEDKMKNAAFSFSNEIIKVTGIILMGVVSSTSAVFNLLSLILISPIVAFYMLRDWDKLVRKIDELLPREKLSALRKNFKKIDNIISAYIRGQGSVCIIMAIFYSVNLTLVGLNSGFAIGLITGILSFIPYVGMAIGAISGLTVAYFQFGFNDGMLLTILVFVFGNIIEGNFITPKLVGDSVELHPAWIIFALLAGGTLFGFTGVLIAIPVAAVVGVLTRSTVEVYKESQLYLGNELAQIPKGSTNHDSYVTEKEETPIVNVNVSAAAKAKKTVKKEAEIETVKIAKKTEAKKDIKKPEEKKKGEKKKKEPELKFPQTNNGF